MDRFNFKKNDKYRKDKKSMVEDGISGITSNPSIFKKALSNEDSYDEEIKLLTESWHK